MTPEGGNEGELVKDKEEEKIERHERAHGAE